MAPDQVAFTASSIMTSLINVIKYVVQFIDYSTKPINKKIKKSHGASHKGKTMQLVTNTTRHSSCVQPSNKSETVEKRFSNNVMGRWF